MVIQQCASVGAGLNRFTCSLRLLSSGHVLSDARFAIRMTTEQILVPKILNMEPDAKMFGML